MNAIKRESCNESINLRENMKSQYYERNIYKILKSYHIIGKEYKRPESFPKKICFNYKVPIYFDIINNKKEELNKNMKQISYKIKNEDNIIREKEEKIFSWNKEKGNLPILKKSRNNEIKTSNNKLNGIFERLYGIKKNNKKYCPCHSFGLEIRYEERLNHLNKNYFNIEDYLKKNIKARSLLYKMHMENNKKVKHNIYNKVVKKYIKTKHNFAFTQDKCLICLVKFLETDNIRYMPCLHLFHSNCIYQWLRRKKNCPLCKYDISFIYYDDE